LQYMRLACSIFWSLSAFENRAMGLIIRMQKCKLTRPEKKITVKMAHLF